MDIDINANSDRPKKIFRFIYKYPKPAIIILFLFTVLIRLPQLSRPLSKHHESNTAAVLVSMQVWKQNGLLSVHGAPVHYIPGIYNTFYNFGGVSSRLIDTGIYPSMGSGSYLWPYLILRLFGLAPSDWFIRAFALLVQLSCSLVIYRLLCIIPVYNRNKPFFPFTGAAIFLTLPSVMWFMGNAYCHESMVVLFYVLMLYFGFRIIQTYYKPSLYLYGFYTLFTAAAIYTDWLGVLAAFVFSIQAISLQQLRRRIPFLLLNTFVVFLIASFILWQYISLIGWEEYKMYLQSKVLVRGLPGLNIRQAFVNYTAYHLVGYGLALLLAVVGILSIRPRYNRFLFVMLAIPLLHYFLFIGFSGQHDFSVLKWAPIIALSATIAVYNFKQRNRYWVIASVMIVSITLYEIVNPPTAKNLSGESYSWMKNVGQYIKANTHLDEYIFLQTPIYYYNIEWYAGRNFMPVTDFAEAQQNLLHQIGDKAIFYQMNEQHEIIKAVRFKKSQIGE